MDVKIELEPFHDRVLVQRASAEEQTKGGILIPETAREKPLIGKVVALGPKVPEHDRLGVGNVVMFLAYAGNEVEIGGKTLIVMRYEEILGRIHGVAL